MDQIIFHLVRSFYRAGELKKLAFQPEVGGFLIGEELVAGSQCGLIQSLQVLVGLMTVLRDGAQLWAIGGPIPVPTQTAALPGRLRVSRGGFPSY